MKGIIDEFDEIYKPKTIGELVLLTRMIIDKKRYLLIENNDEQPILVDIRTANAFQVGVELIGDNEYNKLSDYFNKHGAISTIDRMANEIWSEQRH